MAATIVHFGQDTCFRLPVLRSAGYAVEECESLDRLSGLLAGNADAVMLEEEWQLYTPEAVALTRAYSSAPVVLFRNEPNPVVFDGFDLVIPPLTAPEDWLRQIADLLEHSHAVQTAASELARSSATLRQESASVRDESRRLRECSIDQRSAAIPVGWETPESKPDPACD